MWAFRRFRKVRQAVGVPRVGYSVLKGRKTHDGTVSRADSESRELGDRERAVNLYFSPLLLILRLLVSSRTQ